MTIEEISSMKAHYEYEVKRLLRELENATGCHVSSVVVTSEEGFGIESSVYTVNINLQIK